VFNFSFNLNRKILLYWLWLSNFYWVSKWWQFRKGKISQVAGSLSRDKSWGTLPILLLDLCWLSNVCIMRASSLFKSCLTIFLSSEESTSIRDLTLSIQLSFHFYSNKVGNLRLEKVFISWGDLFCYVTRTKFILDRIIRLEQRCESCLKVRKSLIIRKINGINLSRECIKFLLHVNETSLYFCQSLFNMTRIFSRER
jgi:hypothetical protein